jgi:aryl-alcohol dehydrogenase-like predicted oxidoreductase
MQTVLLGTAQWGLDYGITNAVGRPDDTALDALVATARELGLGILDTAPAYGDAEERIGRAAPDFAVQTKVSALGSSAAGIVADVRASLARLRRARVRSCLVHDWPSLDDTGRAVAVAGLRACRDEGLAELIGISGYTAEDLVPTGADLGGLDLVQVPVSVLDQRLQDAPEVAAVRDAGLRIQARSVLLQGLALADGSSGLAAHPAIDLLRAGARQRGTTRLALCLSYVRTRPWVDEVVLAATTPAELRATVAALRDPVPVDDWSALGSTDVDLIDPRRWS